MSPVDKPPSESPGEVVALSKFRAALARARVTRRADAILAEPDADRLIPTLPIQDLYLAIKDVGLEDAQELVVRASPEQVQGFLDLDAWEGDELSVDRMRPWIDTLLSEGHDKIASIVDFLDPEEIAVFVQKQANVYDITQEDIPEEPEGRFWPTPDTFYILDILAPGEDGKSLERFLDHLYRADLDLARRVVMSARYELPSDLQEWAYRFRQGRMADLGFPDSQEALAIYKPLDPASVKVPEVGQKLEPHAGSVQVPGTTLPAIIAEAIDPKTLLGLGLATHDDAGLEAVYGSLVTLFNRALAADHVEPADPIAARRVLDDVLAYLGLGIEYLAIVPGATAEDTAKRAGRALTALPLEKIFRVGFTLTASLGGLAETLYLRGRVRMGDPRALLLDGRHREIVTALRGAGLRGRRPRMARMLDTPPANGTRAFRSAADIRLAASSLQSAARIPVFFFDDLGLTIEGVGEAVSSSPGLAFGTIARTLAARILVGGIELGALGPLVLMPLRPPEVGALLARLQHGALAPADQATVGVALLARITARGRTAPPELEAWFSDWFANLGKRVAEVDGLYVTA